MKFSNYRAWFRLRSLAPSHWARVISQVDWPVQAGLCAGICGLLMLAASWHIQGQTNELLAASSRVISKQPNSAQFPGQPSQSIEPIFSAPEHNTHLADLGRLFKLAKDKGVNLGAIEYRIEPSTTLPLLVRTLNLRVNEEYPKLKGFVAELLNAMPHVSLQEIRIEHKDDAALQEHVMLKLSFLYQSPPKNSPVSQGTNRSQSTSDTQVDYAKLR